MSTAANFRGLRREIAIALRGRKRTLYEASKAMGRRPGDIQRTLRQMHAEKLIESSDPKPTRGTLFWFNELFADALESALADHRPPGQLAGEQRVLAITAPSGSDPYYVLGRGDLNGMVSWVAEWGGDGELLVGMVQGTPKLAVDQLVRALGAAGIGCVQRRVGELMEAADLRKHAVALDEAEKPVTDGEELHV